MNDLLILRMLRASRNLKALSTGMEDEVLRAVDGNDTIDPEDIADATAICERIESFLVTVKG